MSVSDTVPARVEAEAVVATKRAGAVVGGHGDGRGPGPGRGRSGLALLERDPLPSAVRRVFHDRGVSGFNGVSGFKGPVRDTGEPPPQEGTDAIAAARHRPVPRRNPPPRWMPYLRVTTRFKLSVLCGISWMCLSAWLAWPWINELASSISFPVALLLITGIALIPGYLNVQLVTSSC